MSKNWDIKFFDLAVYISSWSKDTSTKCGAIIVKDNAIISTGYNGMPIGCDDTNASRYERPKKYYFFEHSERNAIFLAAKKGDSTEGATIYVKWFPCADCARAIIQSGIKTLVCNRPDFTHERWGESFKYSFEMLSECGIEIKYIEDILEEK